MPDTVVHVVPASVMWDALATSDEVALPLCAQRLAFAFVAALRDLRSGHPTAVADVRVFVRGNDIVGGAAAIDVAAHDAPEALSDALSIMPQALHRRIEATDGRIIIEYQGG